MDNHQAELALALEKGNYLYVSTPEYVLSLFPTTKSALSDCRMFFFAFNQNVGRHDQDCNLDIDTRYWKGHSPRAISCFPTSKIQISRRRTHGLCRVLITIRKVKGQYDSYFDSARAVLGGDPRQSKGPRRHDSNCMLADVGGRTRQSMAR